MFRKSTPVAQLILGAAAVIVLGSTSIASAQCGNGNPQPSQGELCDNGGANNTQAVGCCAAGCAGFVTAGTVCRPDAGVCDTGPETCTGTSGTCPADSIATSSTVCRASTGICDAAENCDGSTGNCPADVAAAPGTVCRSSQGICDPAETCSGTSCPADAKSSSPCRTSGGICDPAETCDGTNNACPADAKSSSLCRTSAGVCDPAETCDGTNGACPADAKSTSECRESEGICDAAENCNGSSNDCPADLPASPATVCRASLGGCDPAETCSGTSCPADQKSSQGTVCRPNAGVCDQGAETCDGTNVACPADAPASAGTPCRSSVAVCDQAEACNGSSNLCPADTKRSGLCRPSAGDCDLAENCTGSTNDCPANAHSTAECRPAVNENCDVAEDCDGTNDNCPEDVLVNCADDDDLDCTVATCDEFEGCIITDNCVEICRGPGFWATHSGWEKGENIGQLVLDDVGSLEVCGQTITNTTNLGSLDSSLEGLCMRTQGEKQRQLYRTLVTTAFNCAISEGKDCEQITGHFVEVSWEECNALCAGEDVGEDGPTLQECKAQFACFNGGGTIIDGQCATGTCADSQEYCGKDFGDCGEEDECVRFEDNCASQDLCSDDSEAAAEICPKPGPASSPKTCKDARKNSCTIDSCF